MSKPKVNYYIILQPTLRAMGGEEMYTRNKVISAREHGYEPIVLHGDIKGRIFIQDLKLYEGLGFSEFRYDPCVVSASRKRKLANRIMSVLKDYDGESIIESHEILIAEWGEWIAKQLGIRHLAYMLLEHNPITHRPLFDFFKFKYVRHELVGIAKETIPDMFVRFEKDVVGYYLEAHCSNVYENIPCPKEFKVEKADFTIGSIGRINKRCVQPMINAVRQFINAHKDKTFNILYVGGALDEIADEEFKSRFSGIPNATLIYTGMIFPISVEMVRQMDVCLATAGSCTVSRNCGVPTISIDGNDSKAIGVFGKTTPHTIFRDASEPPIDIVDILDDVLIKKLFVKEDGFQLVDMNFSSHWNFISEMTSEKEYYDIDQIVYPFKKRLAARILGFYYGLAPASFIRRVFERCIDWYRNFIHL